MNSKEVVFPTVPLALSAVPTASHMRRRSVRRPLRSSPLTGPALSSEGAIIQDHPVQGRPKPSRISSLPDFPSKPSEDWIDSRTPALFLEPEQSRVSSPEHFTMSSSTPSPSQKSSSPSLLLPHTSSREKISPSLPPMPSQRSTRASHRNSSPLHDTSGNWLVTNTYEETPRFSRLNKGSNVVMPVSVKEHRRKSLASVKSQPNLRDRVENGGDEEIKSVRSRNSLSSLRSRVRQRARALASVDSDAVDSNSSESRYPHSRSSSIGDSSDIESSVSSVHSLPISPRNSEIPISNLLMVDEEIEIAQSTSANLRRSPTPLEEQTIEVLPDHKRSELNSWKIGKLPTDPRSSGFGALKSRTKAALRMSKSFTHLRAPSSGDPVLGSTSTSSTFVVPRKHVKGFSFLSFSSDDSHSSYVHPLPSLPDGTGITSISDTSSESDVLTDDTHIEYQKEAKQLLYDAFPQPPALHQDAIPPVRPFSDHRPLRSPKMNKHLGRTPPSPILKPEPRAGNLSPRTPTSSVFFPEPHTPISPVSTSATIVAPPTPTFRNGNSDRAFSPASGLGRSYVSTLDLSTQSTLSDYASASFLSIGDDSLDSSTNLKTSATGTVSLKAMNLLGVLDDPVAAHRASKGHVSNDKATLGAMKKIWKTFKRGDAAKLKA